MQIGWTTVETSVHSLPLVFKDMYTALTILSNPENNGISMKDTSPYSYRRKSKISTIGTPTWYVQ